MKLKDLIFEGGGFEGRINSIIRDIEKYKIKYLKAAVRKGDWHEIQELGYTLEKFGKQLVKLGIKAGK
jgi:hypothetical protein